MDIKAEIIEIIGRFEVVRISGLKKPCFSVTGTTRWDSRPDGVGYWPAGSTVDDLSITDGSPTTPLRECESVEQAIYFANIEHEAEIQAEMNPEAE